MSNSVNTIKKYKRKAMSEIFIEGVKKNFLVVVILNISNGFCQLVVSEQQAIDSVLKNHPTAQISNLKIGQSKERQKSAFNIPNPDVIMESPTGEFYTVGVLQQMQFPTVYSKQNQLAHQQTTLSEREKTLSILGLKYQIRQLYLNFQYSHALLKLLKVQDSAYSEISKIANRKFEVGEIDLINKTFANSQSGEVHIKYLNEYATYQGYLAQMRIYTNIKDSLLPVQISKSSLAFPGYGLDSIQIKSNPGIQYFNQITKVNEYALKVEKNKALPGIVFGYLNQGPEITPANLRFRAGINIPIWFWQYSGNIKSAKYDYEIAKQEAELQEQLLSRNLETIKQQILSSSTNLNFYESNGMNQANKLYDASKRFFQSSEWDNISFLRIINDVFTIKTNYFLALKSYNEYLLQYHYLNGTL